MRRRAKVGGREGRLMIRSLFVFVALTTLSSQLLAEDTWLATGKYEFTGWAGPQLSVYYSVPPKATSDSPILVIIPGVKRKAEEYRKEWRHSAGGGFVHLFMLMKPKAKVNRAVAANPAFFTMPDNDKVFPFGLKGAPRP